MSLDIVVARYNEDISWMGYLGRKETICVHIYNDGDPLSDYILLKNMIQKEGDHYPCETTKYLSYIIDNYSRLPERIVFTQANPFDHSPDFIGLLENCDKWAPVQPLTFRGHPPPWCNSNILFDELIDKTQYICNNRIFVDKLNDDLQGSIIYDPFIPGFIDKFTRKDIVPYLLDFFGVKESLDRKKAFGACFSVTRDIIQKYPHEFYCKLLKWVINSENELYKSNISTVKENAILMEYLWLPIFQGIPE